MTVVPTLRPLSWGHIFPDHPRSEEPYIEIDEWPQFVTYFVGPNGSGKSRTATRVAGWVPESRLLSTDRLIGIMQVANQGWGALPTPEQYQGIPVGDQFWQNIQQTARPRGLATDELYTLRKEPDVLVRMAAFIQRALSRRIELRERGGFLDPVVFTEDSEHSLLRDEGHGLRELVVLLAAIYRRDWRLLVVDEPELHLHPSMARLWLAELERECRATDRRALIVTHEPNLVRPRSVEHLDALWLFRAGRAPVNVGSVVLPEQRDRVTTSLRRNPSLVSALAFSPGAVLVEGVHDVAALTTALERIAPPESVAQTDLIEAEGSSGVAMWFEIAKKLGLGARAVADLDALFTRDLQRALDAMPGVGDALATDLAATPAKLSTALAPLLVQMNAAQVEKKESERAQWLAALTDADGRGHVARRDQILRICRDAGVWLHPQGTLEAVLGIGTKGIDEARKAAETPGAIDAVAQWCAWKLDLTGDVEIMLNLEVERIAHAIMEAQRLKPTAEFTAVPGSDVSVGKLVEIRPLGQGAHRITVLRPEQFAGWWLDFDRSTPPNALVLQRPEREGAVAGQRLMHLTVAGGSNL